jgi:hypothetical protein
MENIDQPGEGMKKLMAGMAKLPPVDRDLLGRMPAGAMALGAMTSPAQVWELAKGIYTSSPQTALPLTMLKAYFGQVGLDFERDIIGWMKGTMAVGLYYAIKPFPNLILAWDVANPDEVKGALNKIGEAVTRATKGKVQFAEEKKDGTTVIGIQAAELAMTPFLKPAFALTDKTLYFCSLESGLNNLLTKGEKSAADSVAELPKESVSLGIIDFPAFSQFFADLGPVLGTLSSGQKASATENGFKKVSEILNCLGKATGSTQIRQDGSSTERYSLPVGYDALVKVIKKWAEAVPAGASKGAAAGKQ